MAKKKPPFIEECGTGRQWTSTAACADTLGIDVKDLNIAIKNDIPINRRWYMRVRSDDSICWECKNTAEGKCDLFTKRIKRPPECATYIARKAIDAANNNYITYRVTECGNYAPEIEKTIIQ